MIENGKRRALADWICCGEEGTVGERGRGPMPGEEVAQRRAALSTISRTERDLLDWWTGALTTKWTVVSGDGEKPEINEDMDLVYIYLKV